MNESQIALFNDQLRERTLQMAVAINHLFARKNIVPVFRPAVNQIIRSSSSVAANFRAATRGRSDAEFYAKICIVVEEADESYFWMEYLIRCGFLDRSECKGLVDELEQLTRLFNAIKTKMRGRVGRGRSEI